MNKTLLLFIVFLAFAKASSAQDPYEKWDHDFRPLSALDVIRFERNYADSVERDSTADGYYTRLDSCKITAHFMGVKRKILPEVLESMNRINQNFYPGSNKLDAVFKNEYLFECDETKIWMPIDSDIELAFNQEITKGKRVFLYCMFLNEHTKDKKLFNNFMISEFRK